SPNNVSATSIASKPNEVSSVNSRNGGVNNRGVSLPSSSWSPLLPEVVNRVNLLIFALRRQHLHTLIRCAAKRLQRIQQMRPQIQCLRHLLALLIQRRLINTPGIHASQLNRSLISLREPLHALHRSVNLALQRAGDTIIRQ